jgi:hypothetical protein
MNLGFSGQILNKKKYWDIKFDENPCSGSRLFHADAQTQTDRQTDRKNPVVAFRSFANAPKINLIYY